MKSKVTPISVVADSVLADIERVERTKTAEAEAIREASKPQRGSLSTALHKLAAEVRSAPEEVTYADLRQFLTGGAA